MVLHGFDSSIKVFLGGVGGIGGWVGDKNKFVSRRWMGLITTSLELYKLFLRRENTFVCFTVGYNNFGVEFE